MPSDSDNTELIVTLREEIKITAELIMQFIRTSDQVLTVAVAAVAAGAAYAAKVGTHTVQLLVVLGPFFAAIIAAYALRVVATLEALGSYRRHLETKLAAELTTPNVLWESAAAPTLKRSAAYVFSDTVLSSIFLVLVACATADAFARYESPHKPETSTPALFWGLVASYVLLGALLMVVRVRTFRIPRRISASLQDVEQRFSAKPPADPGQASPPDTVNS